MDDVDTPDHEEASPSAAEKASKQLQKLVDKAIDTGVGPLSGSISWAEERLARVQGPRYEANVDPQRKIKPGEEDDIEKTIRRLITGVR